MQRLAAFAASAGSFYHIIHLNTNAADAISFMLDVLATARASLVAVDGGSHRIVEALLAQLRGRVDIQLGVGVRRLRTGQRDGGVLLKLDDGRRVRAHSVLLTGAQPALRALHGVPHALRPLLDAVTVVSLFKIFIVLDDPPFGATDTPAPNTGADKVPCREIHYSFCAANNTGCIMARALWVVLAAAACPEARAHTQIYGDVPSLNYWSAFVLPDGGDAALPQSNGSPHLAHHLMCAVGCTVHTWQRTARGVTLGCVHARSTLTRSSVPTRIPSGGICAKCLLTPQSRRSASGTMASWTGRAPRRACTSGAPACAVLRSQPRSPPARAACTCAGRRSAPTRGSSRAACCPSIWRCDASRTTAPWLPRETLSR